jgi:hypothetical protein
MPRNSPNLLFIGLLLEVSRMQANGKTYVELHPRTYVEFATKRHDFFQLNQKSELVRLASHCW